MHHEGNLYLKDSTHESYFQGYLGYSGYLYLIDTTSISSITGLVIDDSTRLPYDSTFFQNSILSTSDMTMTLADWTYAHGRLNPDGTYVDGTFGYHWFDPVQLYYSVYYQSYDTSDFSLVGYKFREPVRTNVGQYYASMVTPDPVGHYENRWTYLRDNSGSYGKEIVQPFTNMSRGLDYMPDYPGSDSSDST